MRVQQLKANKKMKTMDDGGMTITGTAIQGGVTSILALYFMDTLTLMIPFIILAAVAIITDLCLGIQAARAKGKEIRASTAIRKTMNKIVEYTCCIILGASLAVSFGKPVINYVAMVYVFGNEVISIISNFNAAHGRKITGLYEFLLKLIGKKTGIDTSDIHIEEIEEVQQTNNIKEQTDD